MTESTTASLMSGEYYMKKLTESLFRNLSAPLWGGVLLVMTVYACQLKTFEFSYTFARTRTTPAPTPATAAARGSDE